MKLVSRRATVGLSALLAGLSAHGVTMIVLAILLAWIIGSDRRTARVTRIISAWRGDARSQAPGSSTALPLTGSPPAASRQHRRRPAQRPRATRSDGQATKQPSRKEPDQSKR